MAYPNVGEYKFVFDGATQGQNTLTFVSQSASTPDTTATWSKNTPRRIPTTNTRLPTNTKAPRSLAPTSKMHSSDAISSVTSAGHQRLIHL